MKKFSDSVRGVRAFGRSDGAVGAGAQSQPGRIAGRLRKRCRNAFRQIHRTRARLCRPSTTGSPPRAFAPSPRSSNLIVKENGLLARRAFGHAEIRGHRPRPSPIRRKMQEALKASYVNLQKSDYGTFRQRPAGAGEIVRKRLDEAGRA